PFGRFRDTSSHGHEYYGRPAPGWCSGPWRTKGRGPRSPEFLCSSLGRDSAVPPEEESPTASPGARSQEDGRTAWGKLTGQPGPREGTARTVPPRPGRCQRRRRPGAHASNSATIADLTTIDGRNAVRASRLAPALAGRL